MHKSYLKFAKGGAPTHQGYDTGYAAILDKKKKLGSGRFVIAKDNLSKGHTGQGYDDGQTINGDNKFISINAYKAQNSSVPRNTNYLYKISKKGHGGQGYSYGFSSNTIQNSFIIKSFNKY